MAFIISKKSKVRDRERNLYYLVRNYREGKKIKRVTIVPLGESPNLSEALLSIREQEKEVSHRYLKLENDLERAKKGDLSVINSFSHPHKQIRRMEEYFDLIQLELERVRKNASILGKYIG